jgi:hypothetical protein
MAWSRCSGDAGGRELHKLDLSLNVEDVPVRAVAQLARRAKKGFATGSCFHGECAGQLRGERGWESRDAAKFQGRGEISNLRLQSANTKVELAPGSVPFTLSSEPVSDRVSSRSKGVRRVDNARFAGRPNELHIEYGPFPVALGRPVPAQARGWVGRSGYAVAVRGDGEVSHMLRMASLLGLPAVKASAEGAAQIDLQIAGSWTQETRWELPSGFPLPRVTEQCNCITSEPAVRGVNEPIEISSAELKLLPDEARVEKLECAGRRCALDGLFGIAARLRNAGSSAWSVSI